MDLSFDSERLPLAARLRPRTLDEFIGQNHIVGPGRLLRRAIQADQLSSLILSGPPGTGKTTLARIIAARTSSQFLTMNAVLSGVKNIREAIEAAKAYRASTNRRTILFVDEVHRWNKSQQDALLPWVEDGLFVLIGATTENPFFEVNRALLSRSRVFLLTQLTSEDLHRVLDFALNDRERGYGDHTIVITPDARNHLVETAAGDARTLLNALELAVETSGPTFPLPKEETITIDLSIAEDSIQKQAVLYDKDGDYHFDTISAFIKSVRGSDPDASLYWLARMIEAGEDPHYIFRRLLVSASEDIGLADPQALGVVIACSDAFDRVGMPEGRFHLTQATLYLASAEKSNSTLGVFDAIAAVRESTSGEVPKHLKDANRDGADLGHGKGYLYPHAYTDHWVAQQYLPAPLHGRIFYSAGANGWEGARQETLTQRRLEQLALEDEAGQDTWSVPPTIDTHARWSHRSARAGVNGEMDFPQLLDRLTFSATDRVLITGDGVGTFVYPVFRSSSAGITVVWTTPRIAQSISYAFGSAIDTVDAPEVHNLEAIPPDAYSGPFETIIGRWLYPTPPAALLKRYLPMLAEGGSCRFIDTEILSGDRPSTFLGAHLDPETLEVVRKSETAIFPTPSATWEKVLTEHNRSSDSKLEWAIDTVDRTESRLLDPQIIGSWLAESSPLGQQIRTDNDDIVDRVLTVINSIDRGEYPWKRVYTIVTIRRRSG